MHKNVLWAIAVTLLAVPAVLLLLLNVLVAGFYTADVPSGSNAIGLIVPLILSIIGGVMMMVATWICVGAGGLDWISSRPMVPLAVASSITLGVSLAAAGLLIAWMEKMGAWVIPSGVLFGAIAPILLGGILLTSVWKPQAGFMKARFGAGAFLVVAASFGIALGAFGAVKQIEQSVGNRTRIAAEDAAMESEWARKRARSPIEALREDYAEMSPQAPLWIFVASLPDHSDDESRQFIINRSLQVPEFESALGQTITGRYPRYRHGCADLIRFAPDGVVRPEWGAMLSQGILVSAEQIAADPDWFTPARTTNPAPVEHLRAMSEAASRLGMTPELRAAMEKLHRSVAGLPPGQTRDEALAALGGSSR